MPKGTPKDTLSETDRLTANVAAAQEARWKAEVEAAELRLLRARDKYAAAVAQSTEVRLKLIKTYETADDDTYNLDTGVIARQKEAD